MVDFCSAILRGTALKRPPECTLGDLAITLALYRSVNSRQWESVFKGPELQAQRRFHLNLDDDPLALEPALESTQRSLPSRM